MGSSGVSMGRRYRVARYVAGAAIVGGMIGVAAPAAHAALLVNESFNYPTLANGATMNGVTTTGLGLSGTYSVGNGGVDPANLGTFTYQAAGLTLGNLEVSGGSVAFSYSGTAAYGAGNLSVPFSATTTASSLYGSYLFQLSRVGNNSAAGALMGPLNSSSAAYDNYSQVAPLVQAYGGAGNGGVDLSNGAIKMILYGTALTAGTTYISLFQVSGVGATSGTASLSEWILDAAQYNNFAGNGSLNATALNAATLGTGASDVTEAGTTTGTPASGDYPTLNSDLSFWGYSGGLTNSSITQTFADYRLSDTSLAQAAPVPEPATLGLVGAGAIGLLLLGKRRKTA